MIRRQTAPAIQLAERRSSALYLVESSAIAQRVARFLIGGLMLAILAMLWLPWQQTSRGTGKVVAYVPQERQQTVESSLDGVIDRLAPGLVEGSKVNRGDFLLEIQPVAANLAEQIAGQLRDFNAKLETAEAKAEAYQNNVTGYTEAQKFTVRAAQELVESAQAKLESKQRLVRGYEAKVRQAKLNYDRQASLFEAGLKPEREIEKLKQELDVAQAELESVRGEVESLESELAAKQHEMEEERQLAQTKIDYAEALRQDALGQVATIRKEIRDLELKQSELVRQKIFAPRDGTIYRLPVYERGQLVKAGEPLLTIVPEVTQKGVELYVAGNDMPLVHVGQDVRLQFEGWPAVQFAGWPSIAVGTFGGVVASIDPTDNERGQFRILVIPSPHDTPWPSDLYLRQGVRVNGWVMLRQVQLGYEIWRQLNGFPPIVASENLDKSEVKFPKIPK